MSTHARIGKVHCGYCATNNHELCADSVRNGDGTPLICPCTEGGCATRTPRCVECHSTEGIDPTTRTCIDRNDCADTVVARVESNPVVRRIREIQAIVAAAHVHEDVVETPKKAEYRSSSGGLCHCGCGEVTKGGRFRMGHDARLRSNLARVVSENPDANAIALALAELIARGGVWEAAGLKALPPTRTGIAGPARELAAQPGFVAGVVSARLSKTPLVPGGTVR